MKRPIEIIGGDSTTRWIHYADGKQELFQIIRGKSREETIKKAEDFIVEYNKSTPIKIWESHKDGTETKYFLSKEINKDWYVTVYKKEGKWVFSFGRRLPVDGKSERYFWQGKGWTNPAGAKKKGLESLQNKIVGTLITELTKPIV